MPRPRAPTRELFEFTNRRRAGGKCDLYRCKRCGREMLENTHRFAIHICICKKATEQDREVAKGQLRKTKKYSMRANNSSALATPEHGCRSETNGQHDSSSPMLYDDSQELLMPLQPTMSRRLSDYQQSSQQNKFDMFDCHLLEPSATIFETVPQGGMALSNSEDHYRMATSSMFDSHCPTAASAHQYQTMAADGGIIFDNNHHQQSSTDPVMMFDQRPRHHTLVSRQRSQMPPSYRHQWGSVYSSSPAFESRPAASASSMGGKQPYIF